MKDYQVKFRWESSVFTETVIVYGVDNREQAIARVKNHYGTKAVKIISARQYKEA